MRKNKLKWIEFKNSFDDDARIFKTYVQMLIIFGIVVVGRWLVLAKAEVATATTAAATVTTSDDTANDETGLQTYRRESHVLSLWIEMVKREKVYLACRRCNHEVRVHILFTELLGDIQAEGSVIIVNIPLGQIAQY